MFDRLFASTGIYRRRPEMHRVKGVDFQVKCLVFVQFQVHFDLINRLY